MTAPGSIYPTALCDTGVLVTAPLRVSFRVGLLLRGHLPSFSSSPLKPSSPYENAVTTVQGEVESECGGLSFVPQGKAGVPAQFLTFVPCQGAVGFFRVLEMSSLMLN
jgi:hypothetical protein